MTFESLIKKAFFIFLFFVVIRANAEESNITVLMYHRIGDDRYPSTSISKELSKIHKIDPSFTVDEFTTGAKKAFEYIINKYSDENIKPLKKLLSADIFKMFDKQINNRAKKNENLDVSIIGIKEAKIEDASIKTSIASIKVKFSSEQVQVIKNDKGKIISGDGNQILSFVESWFFSKDLKRKDPNWVLEKIEESN